MGQEEGAREEEMMSGGRQWKAATNTASGPRGRDDTKYPNMAMCPCIEQVKHRNKTFLSFVFRFHDQGVVHTNAFKAFHHFFS